MLAGRALSDATGCLLGACLDALCFKNKKKRLYALSTVSFVAWLDAAWLSTKSYALQYVS